MSANEQTGVTTQVQPGANEGIAIQSNGVPVGAVVEQDRIDGAMTTHDRSIQKVGKVNFSSDFVVTLESDGSVTVSLA